MMQTKQSELDRAINELTSAFAAKLDSLAAGDYIREGVIKEAITSLVWDIYHQMPDQRQALADALDNWPGIIEDAMKDDRAKAQS